MVISVQAHTTARARSVGEERARRGVAERGREHLIEVDARLEGGAIHAETSLSSAVALLLVDPEETMKTPPLRHLIPPVTGTNDRRLASRVPSRRVSHYRKSACTLYGGSLMCWVWGGGGVAETFTLIYARRCHAAAKHE